MVAIVMFSGGGCFLSARYIRAIGAIAIILFAASSRGVESQTHVFDDGAITDQCERPYPPHPEDYDTRKDYNSARESYYRLASIYVSECIGAWIEASRRQYMEMFAADTRSYNEDRQRVLDDMRDAASTEF